jgi:hypothetical protein
VNITNSDVAKFMSLVDTAVSSSESDVKALPKPVMTGSRAEYDAIHNLVLRTDDLPGPNMRQLLGALAKRAVLDPSLESYRNVVLRLRHGTSNDKRFRGFEDREAWIEGIRLIMRLPASAHSATLGLEREIAAATAVRELRQRGYQIQPQRDGFEYAPGELERACSELSAGVAKVGGIRLIYILLSSLRNRGQIDQGRYLISRRSRPMTGGDVAPSLPFGYLLQMALKFLDAGESGVDVSTLVSDILELATAIVASLDVEHYYLPTPFFQTHETLPGYLKDVIVGDHVLTFRQIAPLHALRMLRGVVHLDR